MSRRKTKTKQTKVVKSEQLRLVAEASPNKVTTPQNLGALIKSVRDIMRKDK